VVREETRNDTVGYGTGTVRYGTVLYMVRYGTVRYSMVRYGTVRFVSVRVCKDYVRNKGMIH
jgi:hypothetical protein